MRRFIALVCCLAGLAACEKGSTSPTLPPKTTPPVVTSPTVSPSPSLLPTGPDVKPGDQPPVLTDPAKANTPQGAVEFVKYYWEVVEWSRRTMDASYLATLATADCKTCHRWTSAIADGDKAGERWVGVRVFLDAATTASPSARPGAAAAADVLVRQEPWRVTDAFGTTVKSYPEERRSYRIFLRRQGAAWIVDAVFDLKIEVK